MVMLTVHNRGTVSLGETNNQTVGVHAHGRAGTRGEINTNWIQYAQITGWVDLGCSQIELNLKI